MPANKHNRRLAVIMATDVVGFSRLMHEDEDDTLASLNACHELLGAEISKHSGRIFSRAGDSALVEFVDAEAAVRAGIGFQKAVAARNRRRARSRRMHFRIGVNLGTAIAEDENLLGDCVNVAARLEGLAEPGGLCISGTVYEQVKSRVEAKYDGLGGRRLKNIDDPVRAYRVRIGHKRRSIYAWGEETAESLFRRIGMTDWDGPIARSRREEQARKLKTRAEEGAVKLRDRAEQAAEDIGRRAGDHVDRLINRVEDLVDRVAPERRGVDASSQAEEPQSPQYPDRRLAVPEGPSVAVLPFAWSADEPGLRYCTDLLTEQIIEALARVSGLLVAAPYSSFAVGKRKLQPAAAGRRLGVRHLVVGQGRIANERLHISIQLIDRTVGATDWEDAFVSDLSELQAMVSKVWPPVAERLGIPAGDLPAAEVRPPESVDAYAYLRRAQDVGSARSEEANREAQRLLLSALDRYPAYARGHALLARAYLEEAQLAWSDAGEDRLERAIQAADRARELDPLLPSAHVAVANVALWMRDHGRAAKACDTALSLAPINADALETMGAISIWSGHPSDAIGTVKQAMRLDPLNPITFLFDIGHAYFCLGHYEDAISAFLRGTIRNPAFTPNHLYLASAYGHLQEFAEARRAMQRCDECRPGTRLNVLLDLLPYARLEDTDRLRDGLHKAGLT